MDIAGFADEIAAEREHQAMKWADGTDSGLDTIDDEKNTAESFVAYIALHSTRWYPTGWPPYRYIHLQNFRKQMVKVATLAYAAIRWADRRMSELEADAESEAQDQLVADEEFRAR